MTKPEFIEHMHKLIDCMGDRGSNLSIALDRYERNLGPCPPAPIAHDDFNRRTALSEGYMRKGGQNPPPQNFTRPPPPPAFKPASSESPPASLPPAERGYPASVLPDVEKRPLTADEERLIRAPLIKQSLDMEALLKELAEAKIAAGAAERARKQAHQDAEEAEAALEAASAERDKWMEYTTGDRAELALKMEAANARIAELEACAGFEMYAREYARAERAEASLADQKQFRQIDMENHNELREKWAEVTVALEAANARIEELNECWLNATGRETKWEAAWADEKARAERAEARVAELGRDNTAMREQLDRDHAAMVEGTASIVALRKELAICQEANTSWHESYCKRHNDSIEARKRAERAETECKALREALAGLLEEWDKLTRYGSPMAKAANPRVAKARAALKETS